MIRETPRIYVADLAAYNNGRLHGVWIDATQDTDEMQEQIAVMLKASPEAFSEEYAIHDYDGFQGVSISEYEGIESAREKAVFVERHGLLGAKVLENFCGDLDTAEKALEEDYSGEHKSIADFAEQLTEDASEIPEHLQFYIDYERMGRDMEWNGDIYAIETAYQEVHIFWSR